MVEDDADRAGLDLDAGFVNRVTAAAFAPFMGLLYQLATGRWVSTDRHFAEGSAHGECVAAPCSRSQMILADGPCGFGYYVCKGSYRKDG